MKEQYNPNLNLCARTSKCEKCKLRYIKNVISDQYHDNGECIKNIVIKRELKRKKYKRKIKWIK